MKGIAGFGEVIGEERIQILFNKLKLITDVDVEIMKDDCASLLSNRDMIFNGFDINL